MTKATALAHNLVQLHRSKNPLTPYIALDATVGNGFDTCFLAECAGEDGMVWGFDIHDMQEAHKQVWAKKLESRVRLIQAGHETLREHLPESLHHHVHAIMFNLGYLPRAEKHYITKANTTIPALDQSLHFLAPQGIITVVCYLGHEGGQEETNAVMEWASALPQSEFAVLHSRFINQRGLPPELVAIYKQ